MALSPPIFYLTLWGEMSKVHSVLLNRLEKKMGLFDQILAAVSDPNQQGSAGQIGDILGTVQQLSGQYGADASTMQTLMSVVGGYVQSSLQETRDTAGPDQAQAVVNQFGGTAPNSEAVSAVLNPIMQQQVVQDLMQRTGLSPQAIESMLPVVIPLVLNLLQGGNNTQNPQAGNSLLNTFLDGNRDGTVDLGDALSMASQFLNR